MSSKIAFYRSLRNMPTRELERLIQAGGTANRSPSYLSLYREELVRRNWLREQASRLQHVLVDWAGMTDTERKVAIADIHADLFEIGCDPKLY